MLKVCAVFLAASVLEAASVQRVQQPSVEDKHFIANTYGFLRSSSDNVGDAASGVLGIQSNLDQLSADLTREYDHWISKKTSLVAENDGLRNQIAHFQGVLQEQQSFKSEEKSLMTEIANAISDTKDHLVIVNKARDAWFKEQNETATGTARLEQRLKEAREQRVEDAANGKKKYNEVAEKNRDIQDQIFKLNSELVQLQNAASNRRVQSGIEHSKIISKNEVIQKDMHALQSKVVAQAQLQQEIRSYEKRLAGQIDERVKQQKNTVDLHNKCSSEVKGLENDVKAAQQGLSTAKKAMKACQVQDASNQKKQAAVNQCLASKKGAR